MIVVNSKIFSLKVSVLVVVVLSLGLSACGGNTSNDEQTSDSHPDFIWEKVATSNNYAPSGDISETLPTFKWALVANATIYQLGHEDVNASTRWHDYILGNHQFNCNANTCSFKPTDVTFTVGDQKAWWIRAKVSGTWGAWSNPHVFKVVNTTTIPNTDAKTISPKGLITSQSPIFKWTPGNGATDYQIGYESQNGTNWQQRQLTATQANCQSSSCLFSSSNISFKKGDKKTWWVRAKINNTWGMWSNGSNFTIKNVVTPPADTAFKIKVDTRKTNLVITASNKFLIGTKGRGYNYHVDCDNDGIAEATGVTANYICIYPMAGEYTISITGRFPQIYYDAPPSGIPNYNTDARKITEVVQWGNNQWRAMDNAFAGAENMIITASDKPDLRNVSTMYRMFWLASKLNQYIGDWDVSGVTNMSDMFGLAKVFNQDVTGWDVSNVTNMAYMFDEAEKFNQDISVWDMSKVTNTSEMFWGAKVFNQPIGRWDMSKVDNMYNMFYKAERFNQDVSQWDITSVKPSIVHYYGMEGLFRGANLSTTNYDKLLISWSRQSVQQNIILDAPTVKYSAIAASARNKLINTYGWIIRDAGQL